MNVAAWLTIIWTGFICWALLYAGATGKLSKKAETALGVLAILSALIAGYAALFTWIRRLVGWIIDLHPIMPLIALAASLLTLGFTFFALWLNQRGWVPLIVAAWVALPSLIREGVFTGDVGTEIAKAIMNVASELFTKTQGWWQ